MLPVKTPNTKPVKASLPVSRKLLSSSPLVRIVKNDFVISRGDENKNLDLSDPSAENCQINRIRIIGIKDKSEVKILLFLILTFYNFNKIFIKLNIVLPLLGRHGNKFFPE